MVEKTKNVKVKALGPYKVVNSKLGISYSFKSGEIYEIPSEHLNVLLDTKTVEEIKNG